MKEVRRLAEYVTLIEAAELEGVKYKTMAQRLNRNPDKFDTMTEKSENGGKDAVLVAVASLSKKARNAWKERAKLKELSGTISPEGEAQPEPEAPWYVEADVDWYIENYREQWYKGMELGNVIREFLQYDGANKTEYAEQYAQEHLGSGKRTLYRYVKAYNEACAWADKLQKESGVGFEFFKVLCLCRKPKESGTFPSIKPEVKQVIKNIWFNEDFAANLGTREMLYEKLTLVANVNKWEKIPSYQTVTRYITYLMEDEGMKNAHFLASKGSREYKNKVMVKGSRDTSGLKVMQIVMGDEHTFDCWVAYKQPNGKVIPIKPHLAAWVDMRSRAIMGDVLCKDANSDILKQSLLKMMYSEPGGIPEYLYIDNGKRLIGEGVWNTKVKENTETKYKYDGKFEKMLKAIFTGDYTFEVTLEEFLDQMPLKPDDKQKKLLLKKLKGDFEKDKDTLTSVLLGGVKDGESAPDFDVELWYIYRIKNAELIRAFLPEELIDNTINEIRKCILVETKTSITLDYKEEE